MEAIIFVVSFLGAEFNDCDFITLYFYIELTFRLVKNIENYKNDKTTNGR